MQVVRFVRLVEGYTCSHGCLASGADFTGGGRVG